MKIMSLFCLLLGISQLSFASTTQSIETINKAVRNFVESSLAPDGQYQISEAQIDNRLRLPACEQNLDVFSQSGAVKPGRNTVGIRCNDSNGWTIYSTVLIKSFKNVLILTKQLNRNERISLEHLRTESRDIATLQQGYLTDPEDIADKQAIRILAPGTVLTRQHFTEPTLIKRGQRVSIQSGKAGFMISAVGVAMTDGSKGQRISVKNISSKRIIQATVENPGVVTVYF